MATKPTIATVAVGQKISASLWNNAVYNGNNFWMVTKPLTILTAGSTQSGFTSGSFASINFDTEGLDTDSQHSTVTNTSRVVIGGTLGWYRLQGAVSWATLGAVRYGAKILLNGTVVNGSEQYCTGNTTAITSTTFCSVQSTVSTDYIELQGMQQTGGTGSTSVSNGYRPYLIVEYMGQFS